MVPLAKAAMSGVALCRVPKTVAPRAEPVSRARDRAIRQGSSSYPPMAIPRESMTLRLDSWTTSPGQVAHIQ